MTAASAPAPVATISGAIVGTEVGPVASAIDARWLMAYAAALGEEDPRYFDTGAPAGPAAHPLFAVCYEWPAALAVRARAIAEALAPLGVHATHRLVIHRPPRAGDTVFTTACVTSVERKRAGTLVVVRFTTVDANGAPVTTTDHGSVYRGVGGAGAPGARGGAPAAGGSALPPAARVTPAAGEVRWVDSVTVPAPAAHVYTECARIWNPIHTDLAVARAAGLPGLILHGTATLGLAVSRVLAREAGGDPTAVREVAARFTGMVPLPSTFIVRSRAARGGLITFDAVRGDGAPILGEGALHL
jgi:acyl dehydratase